MRSFRLSAWCAVPLCLCASAWPAAAQSGPDACALLTPAQIDAAVGTSVGGGQHVTPTYVKTCTWTASGKDAKVKIVTLFLQTAVAYDGGKQMAGEMAGLGKGGAVKPAGVGDDGYYFVAGDQVGLLVKKGVASFKVSVYATLPVEQKEAMELALARQVVPKL